MNANNAIKTCLLRSGRPFERLMDQTHICVAWSNGRWRVTESGPRNSIACFGERQDAMDYAKDLAERTRGSSLVVRNDDREPELETDLPIRASRLPARRLTVRS